MENNIEDKPKKKVAFNKFRFIIFAIFMLISNVMSYLEFTMYKTI